MKIHSVGTELFHADGHADRRIDMTKLRVAFGNFSNASKMIKNIQGLSRYGDYPYEKERK